MKKHYVYTMIDPRTNIPFYVGKGIGRRMTAHINEAKRHRSGWTNIRKCEMIISILSDGLDIKYDKIYFDTDEEARQYERDIISKLGLIKDGGCLTNAIPGGGGFGHHGKTVYQYTKDGSTLIATYESASKASDSAGISTSAISACCRRKQISSGGFQWVFDPKDVVEQYKRVSQHRKTVYQFDRSGTLIASYSSSYEAASAMGKDVNASTKIGAVCRGEIPSYCGFLWSFTDQCVDTPQPQKKTVIQTDLITGERIEHESIAQAAKTFGGAVGSISRACAKTNGVYKGHHWSFG